MKSLVDVITPILLVLICFVLGIITKIVKQKTSSDDDNSENDGCNIISILLEGLITLLTLLPIIGVVYLIVSSLS